MVKNNIYINIMKNEEDFLETYSNNEELENKKKNYKNKNLDFLIKLYDKNIYTKANDIWKYYKLITKQERRLKQKDIYNLISIKYGNPIKHNNVLCYAGLMIKPY